MAPALGSGPSLKAADGHNVDGWADEDIRIYNELLSERAKLEREKNELEQKSSRHQTQRALLAENSTTLDNLFRVQFGGEVKFVGESVCCLDTDLDQACAVGSHTTCGHDICTRAKTKGVSLTELDTIKYYHARILSEKSQRMQNALRKQRDVELVRVKREDELELAWRARRAAVSDKDVGGSAEMPHGWQAEGSGIVIPASLDTVAPRHVLLDPKNSAILEAAKENEHVVRRIRGRLERIRHDVNAGKVSPADARVSLDQANVEMAEAERKNNEFRQLIMDAEPTLSRAHQADHASLANALQNTLAASTTDNFSNALNVMRGFFSTSDPQEVQTAIGELRRVLEVNGPMTPILQKSFQALSEMLAKSNARVSNTDATGATPNDGRSWACHDYVDVTMHLRPTPDSQSSTLGPRELNLDKDTIKANFECIKVEEAAKKDMEKIAERMSDDTADNVAAALKKVKSKALLKSPIPPLSEIVLEDVITDILYYRSVKALVAEAAGAVTLSSISGKLTSLVINMARKEPEKYVATLELVKFSIKKILSTQNKTPSAILSEAVSKVEDSIPKFVAAHEAKLRKGGTNNKIPPTGSTAASETISSFSKKAPFAKYLLTGDLVDRESWNVFMNFFRTQLVHDAGKVRDRVMAHYRKHRDEGIWEIFRVVADHHTLHNFRFEPWQAEKELYRANMTVAALSREKVLDAILAYQKRGICPGMAAVAISQRLTYQVRDDFDAAKSSTMLLRNLFDHYKPLDNRDWFQSFSFIAQAMIDLFAVIIFQAKGLDPKDAPILAADVVGIVCTFVLRAESPTAAATNLHVIQAFISSTLVNHKDDIELGKLQGVLLRFLHICGDSRYRCTPDHACKALITAFNTEKYKALVPAPLNVSKQPQPKNSSNQHQPQLTLNNTIEYLKQSLASQPAEKLVPIRIYMQCVHDWETATLLAPHLRCLQSGKTCTCSKEDQLAAEDFQIRKNILDAGFEELKTYLKNDEDPPRTLWVRLEKEAKSLRALTVRKADEAEKETEKKAAQGRSRFAEHIGHDSEIDTRLNTRRIKLKQVAVNFPRIQNNLSSNSSVTGNLEKDSSEDSAIHQAGKATSAANQASTSKMGQANSVDDHSKVDQPLPPSTSASINAPHLTDRELVMMKQLVRFVDGIFKLEDTTADISGLSQKEALRGISKQLRQMAVGHLEMAWIVTEAQGYFGLQAWIERNFGRNDADGTDTDDDEDLTMMKDATTASYEKGRGLNETQEQIQDKQVTPASGAASVAQQHQQATTATETTGHDSSAQKKTGSQRRKRLPKGKR
ncbi:hypothetical protein A1O3_02574 [Capronia epimyces CBS 606.96]|uniref:Uncharacterized protein n=1 Tax=Capronia epimyces CBS 606.96 TaxID=1182542 RepID=W9Y9I8_9EURO|nr:uncharacterized protein A1O3_02574 [Capronia epimyces CBS 606.96]EXJ89507.1 hypothetical protein A1O3_02574 [Capronia epimyces CBS 606.96]